MIVTTCNTSGPVYDVDNNNTKFWKWKFNVYVGVRSSASKSELQVIIKNGKDVTFTHLFDKTENGYTSQKSFNMEIFNYYQNNTLKITKDLSKYNTFVVEFLCSSGNDFKTLSLPTGE